MLFILASVAAIAGGSLLLPLDDPGRLSDGGPHVQFVTGALLEVVLGISVIAIAAMLTPVLRHAGEGAAMLYVAVRTFEGTLVLVGALSALVMTSLAGSGLTPALEALILHTREWAYHLGTVLMFAVSAVVLNALLLRGRQVPPWLAWWGLLGGALLLLRGVLEMYEFPLPTATQLTFAAPIAVQEMVFAGWLVVKGLAPGAAPPVPASMEH
ncbi:DUF4386 domain-containing protein [Actinoplanes sp. CA-030573]|uniref:DUF4386 domain-containing protein n=1 Tax=Actinoplanes sp. CA-030573 TaxID=3239898 RepID=UPI003D8A96E4